MQAPSFEQLENTLVALLLKDTNFVLEVAAERFLFHLLDVERTLVFFLAKMGIITARYLIRQFRYAVLLFVVVAAVITPTGDPLNLMIFTAPMIGLYGISIGIAGIVGRKTLRD